MKRRTLLGLGATVGGASILGTNAFSNARADRRVDVEVVGDGNAFLQIEPCSDDSSGSLSPSDFVETDGGTVAIDLTENNDRIPNGDGITKDSLWRIPNAFRITNAGTRSVCVDLGFAGGVPEIKAAGEAEVLTEKRSYEPGDPAVVFYPATDDSDEARIVPKEPDTTDPTAIHLQPSDSQCIGFNIRTFGLESDSTTLEGLTLLIRATTGDECEADENKPSVSGGPGPIESCPVTLDLDDLGPDINRSPPSELGPTGISVDVNGGKNKEQEDGNELCIGGNCDSGDDGSELVFQEVVNKSEGAAVEIQPEKDQTIKIGDSVRTNGGDVRINTEENSGTVKIGGSVRTDGGGVRINTGGSSGTVKIGGRVDAQANQTGNDGGKITVYDAAVNGGDDETPALVTDDQSSITVRGAEIGDQLETDGEIKVNAPDNIDNYADVDRTEVAGAIVSAGEEGGGKITLGKADVGGAVTTDGQADITIVDAEVAGSVESNGGAITVGSSDNDSHDPAPSNVFGDIASTADGDGDGGDITIANVNIVGGRVTSSGGKGNDSSDGGSGGSIYVNVSDNVTEVPRSKIAGAVTSSGGDDGNKISIRKASIGDEVTTKGQKEIVIAGSDIDGSVSTDGSIKINQPDNDDNSGGETRIAGNVRTSGESSIAIDAHDTSNSSTSTSVEIDGVIETSGGDININGNIDDEDSPGPVDISGLIDAGGGEITINPSDDAVGPVNIGGSVYTEGGDDGDSVGDITIRSAAVCGSVTSIGGDEASGGDIYINDPDNINSDTDVDRTEVGGAIVSMGEKGGGKITLGKADVGGAVTTDGQADITIVDAEVAGSVESNGGAITVGSSDNDSHDPAPSNVFGDIASTADGGSDGGDIVIANVEQIDGDVTSSGGESGGSGGKVSINNPENIEPGADSVPETKMYGSVTSTGGDDGGDIIIANVEITGAVTTNAGNVTIGTEGDANVDIGSNASEDVNTNGGDCTDNTNNGYCGQ